MTAPAPTVDWGDGRGAGAVAATAAEVRDQLGELREVIATVLGSGPGERLEASRELRDAFTRHAATIDTALRRLHGALQGGSLAATGIAR